MIDPHGFAMGYEFRGDNGDYTPTEAERVMIEDAISGYLSEVQSARRKLAEATAGLAAGHVFADADPEAQWLKDCEDACPHCGGSGHKDDVQGDMVTIIDREDRAGNRVKVTVDPRIAALLSSGGDHD